ncbi:MAG: hypothetical protein K0S76_962 [Herbinix sp.]|jgi:hypothetical protein|nr:hypothetical protein [Herbinix sp.]
MGEIVVGGFPFDKDTEEVRKALKYVKDHGFTSVQLSVRWREIEPCQRGSFDWEVDDRKVRLIQEAGLKFVPFIHMGPKSVAPDWWLSGSLHKGLVCLEHHKENPIESIWNPMFRVEVDRVLKAYAEHYLPWDILESIQPGISGDYGEAIFPVVGNWPGDYHTHRGFWCGGLDAIEDFQSAMKDKYGRIDLLNYKWRSSYQSFEEIKPFLRIFQPSRTAYMDFLLWYHKSMTDYSEFWMETCRKHFPDTPIYLCTGGIEEPEHGSSFSDQAKIAAKYQGGIRLTNEGNNFYENLYLTIHMHSACEYYGSYMGLEPVGPILPMGVAVRMYGSAAYGDRQIFHYYANIREREDETSGAEYVKKYQDLISERKTDQKITFFWPLDEALLNQTPIPDSIRASLSALRKNYMINVADEQMILDDALNNSKLLILLDTSVTRTEVLEKIADWVEKGGVLISNCHPHDLENRTVERFGKIFGMNEDSEEVWGHSEYFVHALPWMEKLQTLEQQHSMIAWNKLDTTVIPLMKNLERKQGATTTREAFCAFANRFSEGMGFYFAAPLDLDAQADAIWTPSPAFSYLLEDCCKYFGSTEPMSLSEKQIAKSIMNGRELVLFEDGTIGEE